jgi:hypothetical protein
VRVPKWFATALEKIGKDVLAGHLEREDAEASIHDQISGDQDFADEVLADFARRELRKWIKHQLRAHYQSDGSSVTLKDEEQLLFDFLPPHLEVGIGRLAHQSVMNGKDWDNTIAVYENRLEQAEISYRAVRRAYDEVRPLLIGESLTTADVAPQVIENRRKRASGDGHG